LVIWQPISVEHTVEKYALLKVLLIQGVHNKHSEPFHKSKWNNESIFFSTAHVADCEYKRKRSRSTLQNRAQVMDNSGANSPQTNN
jgi:hypothetical protein